MTCRRLITAAVATRVSQVAVAAKLTVASCAAPAKIARFVDQATAVGIAESVIATPSTRPNGTAGMNNGIAARNASAVIPRAVRSGSSVAIARRGYDAMAGIPAVTLVSGVPCSLNARRRHDPPIGQRPENCARRSPDASLRCARLIGPVPQAGRVVESVESHGKHLEIEWDDGLVLDTHMRMTGSWQLYRLGDNWRRPYAQIRAAIEVDDWVAVCFNAPTSRPTARRTSGVTPAWGGSGPICARPTPISVRSSTCCSPIRTPPPASPRCCSISG